MNNKGFTLIEMLAVIVILGIVSGIAVNGVISYIDTSKEKSEKIFIENLEKYIDNYIDVEKNTLTPSNPTNTYTFTKCRLTNEDGDCISVNPSDPNVEIESYNVDAVEFNGFNLLNITAPPSGIKIIDKKELINPANKKECFQTKNPTVKIYRDDDYVYYYYLDLTSNNDCEIHGENLIITNLPKNLCEKIFASGAEQC